MLTALTILLGVVVLGLIATGLLVFSLLYRTARAGGILTERVDQRDVFGARVRLDSY
jgi:uncharacterized membrane protein YqiK